METQKFDFFQKNLKLNFDLCQRAEIVQVGLNMNLYDDIGDASSSLRGSTSSFKIKIIHVNDFKIKKKSSEQFSDFKSFLQCFKASCYPVGTI